MYIQMHKFGLKWIFKTSKDYGRLCNLYQSSPVVDISSKKYIVSTGHRYSWYHQRRCNEDADGEARIPNPQPLN